MKFCEKSFIKCYLSKSMGRQIVYKYSGKKDMEKDKELQRLLIFIGRFNIFSKINH